MSDESIIRKLVRLIKLKQPMLPKDGPADEFLAKDGQYHKIENTGQNPIKMNRIIVDKTYENVTSIVDEFAELENKNNLRIFLMAQKSVETNTNVMIIHMHLKGIKNIIYYQSLEFSNAYHVNKKFLDLNILQTDIGYINSSTFSSQAISNKDISSSLLTSSNQTIFAGSSLTIDATKELTNEFVLKLNSEVEKLRLVIIDLDGEIGGDG